MFFICVLGFTGPDQSLLTTSSAMAKLCSEISPFRPPSTFMTSQTARMRKTAVRTMKTATMKSVLNLKDTSQATTEYSNSSLFVTVRFCDLKDAEKFTNSIQSLDKTNLLYAPSEKSMH